MIIIYVLVSTFEIYLYLFLFCLAAPKTHSTEEVKNVDGRTVHHVNAEELENVENKFMIKGTLSYNPIVVKHY